MSLDAGDCARHVEHVFALGQQQAMLQPHRAGRSVLGAGQVLGRVGACSRSRGAKLRLRNTARSVSDGYDTPIGMPSAANAASKLRNGSPANCSAS
jgi:hypothetical protein